MFFFSTAKIPTEISGHKQATICVSVEKRVKLNTQSE